VRRAVTAARVRAFDGDRVRERPDKLVTEEPMEIRVHGPGQEPDALAVTMRTPGNDFELAVGFCATESILRSVADLDSVAYCLAGEGEQEYNVVTVKLRQPVDLAGHERTSSPTPVAVCAARRHWTRWSSSARRSGPDPS
jgi:FdhD protein